MKVKHSIPCPDCGAESSVIDTRPVESENATRRRRECLACLKRFTTKETIVDEIERHVPDEETEEMER